MNLSEHDKEKILELHKEGKQVKTIVKKIFKNDITTDSYNLVYRVIEEFYKQKGETEFKREEWNLEEEIYKLRKERKSYAEISMIICAKGYKIATALVDKLCKEAFRKRGEEDKYIDKLIKIEEYNEEIYELREKGYSYKEISEILKSQGKLISPSAVTKRCYEKFDISPKKTVTEELIDICGEEIYELRKKGLTYEEISNILKEKGIQTSTSRVNVAYKKISEKKEIEKEKKKDINKFNKECLVKKILEIKKTRSISDEEIRKIALFYGVCDELDKIKSSSIDEER